MTQAERAHSVLRWESGRTLLSRFSCSALAKDALAKDALVKDAGAEDAGAEDYGFAPDCNPSLLIRVSVNQLTGASVGL